MPRAPMYIPGVDTKVNTLRKNYDMIMDAVEADKMTPETINYNAQLAPGPVHGRHRRPSKRLIARMDS